MSRFFQKPDEHQEAFSTAGVYGLQVLYEPEDARVDIIFVHGLTGNRETTWTHEKSGTFWPKDLLPEDVKKARIMTFGYDADIVSAINTVSSNTLRDHGSTLAFDIARKRTRTASEDRPLMFVAHSLGGLVVMQALLISRGRSEDSKKALLESTVGIAFMGTPHMGSDHAQWAKVLTRLSSLFRTTNSSIVDVLARGSEMLANLQQEFHTMLDDRMRNHGKTMDLFCFYEEIAMVGVGEIVPHYSAILPAYDNVGIHATHTEMTKFPTRDDTGYDRVSGLLWDWCARLPTEASVREMRDRRVERFGQVRGPSQQWSGTVNSGSGTVVQGNGNVWGAM